MTKTEKPERVKWASTITVRALVLLRKRSEATGIPMGRLITNLILAADEKGWK